ncbi:MAG: type III pantothenate kinase, partial [Flavobacteriales bacterium]
QGGRISPGLHMRLEAMHKQTGKLPLVNPLAYHPQIGKSTEEALFSGAFYGLLHEIEGTITAFKQDYSSLNIILTGGDAKRFDKRLKNSIFADEFFLLKGLTHILKYNDQTPNP